MTYEELLKRPEWHSKCSHIIKRDKHRCVMCGDFGFHPQSYLECDNILELKEFLSGITINNMDFVDFIDNEYRSDEGFTNSKAKVINIYNSAKPFVKTMICKCPDWLSFEKDPNVYTITHEIVYPKKEGYKYDINILSKNYGIGWDKNQIKYDNTISVNFGKNFVNKIDIANAFKFEKKLTDKCVFSCWMEPMTGACGDQWGVTLLSSIMISVTYKNFCFTMYLYPSDYAGNKNPIVTKGLNVHHKYYIKTKLPWEYNDDALITLCEECHKLAHQTHATPVYRNARIAEAYLGNAVICNRCGGSGYLPQYDYVENGICFKCWGEGVVLPY